MTEFCQGNILEASAEALVNTVNTVGIMGKGVALQFRRAFPDNYKAYAAACKRKEVEIGKVFVFDRNTLEYPRYIFNFPTKVHWRGRSHLKYIQAGLDDLVYQVQHLGIQSIAVPPLGCGNGGLDWDDVRYLIEEASAELPEVEFMVYEPQVATEPVALATRGPKPRLTAVRAALLKLFAAYEASGEPISRVEAQKLAYFLQSAGMKELAIPFNKGLYGPYADALYHVLEPLEGHYLEGLGDRTTNSRIHLKPDVVELANAALEDHPQVIEQIERTAHLIQGFESRYGMELLATMHWVAHREQARDFDSAVEAVQLWSRRKQYAFTEDQLRIAWKRLLDEGWTTSESAVVSR